MNGVEVLHESSQKKWFTIFIISLITAVLLFTGFTVNQIKNVPPIPQEVKGSSTLYTKDDIIQGKAYFQKYVLMDQGTILGNGAYMSPDYTAMFLDKKIRNLQNIYATEKFGKDYSSLSDTEKASVDALVKKDMREVSILKEGTTTITPEHEKAFNQAKEELKEFLVKGNPNYAQVGGIIKPEEAEKIVAFVDWTALTAASPRPGTNVTYTNNWPPEPRIGLTATYSSMFWSLVSFMAIWTLTIVILWAFYDYFMKFNADKPAPSLHITSITPMQEKVLKFVPLVPLFFFLQTVMGGYLAHLYADPAHSWIIPQSLLPFNAAREFHLNLAVLWIAIGWLAGGLFIAPIVTKGKDFKFPIAVDILWVALVIVGVGGLIGLWLGALGKLPDDLWFWIGSEGREYLELGRLWDIGIVIGGINSCQKT